MGRALREKAYGQRLFSWAKKLEWLAQYRNWFKWKVGLIPLLANSNQGRPDSQ